MGLASGSSPRLLNWRTTHCCPLTGAGAWRKMVQCVQHLSCRETHCQPQVRTWSNVRTIILKWTRLPLTWYCRHAVILVEAAGLILPKYYRGWAGDVSPPLLRAQPPHQISADFTYNVLKYNKGTLQRNCWNASSCVYYFTLNTCNVVPSSAVTYTFTFHIITI